MWQGKGEIDKAIDDYSDAIRLDPNDATHNISRGFAWNEKREYGKAIADFDEAIRLNPKSPPAYLGRGEAWGGKREFDKAIADFDAAIRLDPKNAPAYNARGRVWEERGRSRQGGRRFRQGDPPRIPIARRQWGAWRGCGRPAPTTTFAMARPRWTLASKACELSHWKDFNALEALAAGCAESGLFGEAVQWQTKAIELAPATDKAELQTRLDLYKAHKTYREQRKKK